MALITPAADLSSQEESGVTVKKEKEDEDIAGKNKLVESNNFVAIQQVPEVHSYNSAAAVVSNDQPRSSSNHSVQISSKSSETSKSVKPAPPAIDFASACGAFGWTTIGSVHLPFIMRGEDRFIAVRMVECKIISSYADILPWTVFTCTNIKSYYITENEAKLLNEINGFHCEFQFGYQSFTPKDVVVRLKDTIRFYEFLETCKGKLNIPGANPIFNDQCGYFIINYAPIPFVKKGNNKCIPLNMVYPEGMTPPMENLEDITEWDLAYLRFLCSMANLNLRKLSYDVQLCSATDLQNALGGVPFEEWWPNMQYSSKTENSHHSSSNNILPKWGESVPAIHSTTPSVDNTKKLREKYSNDIQDKESMINQFFGLNKYLDMGAQISKSSHASRNHHEQQNLLNSINSIQNGDKAIFSGTLENFLATSSCNYPFSMNYRHQYNSHLQNSSDYEQCRKSDTSLSPISSNRSRPYPPPPPLVRVGSSRVNSVPGEPNMVPKSAPSIYPYLPPVSSNPQCNPWLARILEPEWLQEDNRSVLQTSEGPENLSRRLSESAETWCSAPGINMNGAGSSNVQNTSVIRETYDQNHVSHPHRGSPRLVPGPGPPPHYPTPPQSSPLQPLSLVDCVNMHGITDIYATRSTPNGLLDLCSPPPSPDTRTALSSSPRGSHLSNYSYQPHVTRLVQVDTRYVVAINLEPHKYNSLLAVPIYDVVNKFLRGTSVQSCQIVLETVFGLHLYECTSLQQEAFAKHNLSISPGSKLVLLSDLKNCLYQLKCLLMEREKMKEKHCDIGPSELPLSKRWCGSARDC